MAEPDKDFWLREFRRVDDENRLLRCKADAFDKIERMAGVSPTNQFKERAVRIYQTTNGVWIYTDPVTHFEAPTLLEAVSEAFAKVQL